ncbi:cytochrome c oxidase subunit 4 [Nocardioides litoris]|uniref:aa3-type cytochrome oxidase subunit IV n=1 Tax=Nocardioides litoris TaxID=1926648 RepID=UPI0011230460|nr:cytochrome c oxidase subunit 4 [Nocardioides litoris]
MRPLVWMSAICASVWGPMIPLYWFTAREAAGTAGLSFVTFVALLLFGYSLLTHVRLSIQLDDDLTAEMSGGAGELGFFPAQSWAPLHAAGAIGVISLGVAVGWWLVVVGAGLAVPAALFWVFEYYVGVHAH